MQDSMPSAIILAKNPRTSSLDELRTYQGNTIYLNNGDEFQIRLFNPLREKIGVQIGMNGDLSQSLLVLNPGEDVIIDRFLDDKSKMLFETYIYDANNKDAVNAVALNGSIHINFFKEKKVQIPNVKLYRHAPLYTFDNDIYRTTNNITFDASTTLTSNAFYSNTIDSQISQNLSFVSDPVPEFKKETGRIEKGNESSQNFHEVKIEFEHYFFHTVIYNLKPTSERSTTVTETKQIVQYCTECGYRRRSKSHNYCPKCGNEY